VGLGTKNHCAKRVSSNLAGSQSVKEYWDGESSQLVEEKESSDTELVEEEEFGFVVNCELIVGIQWLIAEYVVSCECYTIKFVATMC
jgi:hypothetical protein